MIVTDHYIRWQRVDSVARTATGIMAELHGERLSIDVVRADVLRIKISRGGAFDEPPTFAVCVDPLASPADFLLEQDDERVQLITDACRASLWLDPFRIEVHRSDGSPVIETAQDPDGRYWAYATLNDSFTIRRRCRQEDAIFGLGEKSGRHNRKGRDFTLWNTDVLSPYETVEFTAGKAPDDPRGDFRSVEFDPVLRQYPVLLPSVLSRWPHGGILCRQRISRRIRVLPRRGIPAHVPRRSIHRVCLRRSGHACNLGVLHLADRTYGTTTTLVARVPPMPLVLLHPRCRRGRGAAASG